MQKNHKFSSAKFSNDFTDVKELYRSQVGVVYLAKFKYDNHMYILKERKVAELGKRKDIMNEVNLLLQLDNPNVVRCEGWFFDERIKSLFIVLEYCNGGDLYKLITRRKAKQRYMDERYIWFLFHQICLGIKHLHENGIVHRDLKTMNVMCKNGGKTVKIADLGVSRQLSEDTMLLNTFYGTPLYLSPELVENKPYNEKTDIWSLGIMLYEMCTLNPPFKGKTILELAKQITSGKFEALPRQNFSGNLERCIRWLLQVDYTKRPNITQLLQYVQDRLTPQYCGDGYDGADGWSEFDTNEANITELSDDDTISDDGNHDQQDNEKNITRNTPEQGNKLIDLSKKNEDQVKSINNESSNIAPSAKVTISKNPDNLKNVNKQVTLKPVIEIPKMLPSDNNVNQDGNKILNHDKNDAIMKSTKTIKSESDSKVEDRLHDKKLKYIIEENVPIFDIVDSSSNKVIHNSNQEVLNNNNKNNKTNIASAGHWSAEEAKKLQVKNPQKTGIEITDEIVHNNVSNLGDLGRKKMFSILPSEKLLGDVTKSNLLPGPSADIKIEGINGNRKAFNAENINPLEQLLKSAKELVPTYPIINDPVIKSTDIVKPSKITISSNNMINIDVNRVQSLLKKELSVLRKLLQAREMLSATVLTVLNKKNNFSTDKETENELKEQTVNINAKIAKDSKTIQEKIAYTQDRINKLEQALSNCSIEEHIAVEFNLVESNTTPTLHNIDDGTKKSKAARKVEEYSPIRSPVNRDDNLVRDVNKDGIGTVIEVEEIKYNPLESPSKDPFQKKKMIHWLFHYEQDNNAVIRSPRGNPKKERNIRPMTTSVLPIPTTKKHIPRNHSENKILKFDGLYEPNSLDLEDISCPEGRKFQADNDFEKKLFDHDNQVMPKYNHPASSLHDIKPPHANNGQPKKSAFRIKTSDLHPHRQNVPKTKYNIITHK